jgi:WD40 repeat protein
MGMVALVISNILIAQEQQRTRQALEHETQAKGQVTRTFEALQDEQEKTRRAYLRERHTSYLHRVVLVQRELSENNRSRADQLLDDCPPDLRRWEWCYLKRLCHAELHTVPRLRHADGVVCAALGPDGRLLALSDSADYAVRISEALTGKEVITLREGGRDIIKESPNGGSQFFTTVRSVAFSPDGKRMAGGISRRTGGVVKVWNP